MCTILNSYTYLNPLASSRCNCQRIAAGALSGMLGAIVMIHRGSPTFGRLLSFMDGLPVVDCHKHIAGPDHLVRFCEPIAALIAGYYSGDLISAGLTEPGLGCLRDDAVATSDKWPLFNPHWERSQHTAYARIVSLVMRARWISWSRSTPGTWQVHTVASTKPTERPIPTRNCVQFLNTDSSQKLIHGVGGNRILCAVI